MRRTTTPRPLKFLGRYSHEAVAVDPATSVIYLTEDANDPHGLDYRWVPPKGFHGRKGALRALQIAEGDNAGRLQAMSCLTGGKHIADLSEATQPGTPYRVQWLDVPDRHAKDVSVRKQFTGQVTTSRKLEGAYWGDRGAYFVASYARARSQDGRILFANIQSPGHVFAITGPWRGDHGGEGADQALVGPGGPDLPAGHARP